MIAAARRRAGPAVRGGITVSVKLTSRQVGDVTVIDAVGRITLGEGSSLFRDTIRDLAAKGEKKILLNLGEVSYIDSSGIGELVSGFTTVTNHGGMLKLLNLNKRVKDLLQITKLYTVFEAFEDEAAAIRSFA
jgi:anti-sigma B factor antagonist